jgi:hypothetical protein
MLELPPIEQNKVRAGMIVQAGHLELAHVSTRLLAWKQDTPASQNAEHFWHMPRRANDRLKLRTQKSQHWFPVDATTDPQKFRTAPG